MNARSKTFYDSLRDNARIQVKQLARLTACRFTMYVQDFIIVAPQNAAAYARFVAVQS